MTDAIPTGPAIEVQGVSKAYGRSIALNNLDLSVPWGRALTIFGPNGSGKTTSHQDSGNAVETGRRHDKYRRSRREARRGIGPGA